MSHARFDNAALESLTNCVRDIEQTSDAELVLVVRGRSGSYRHTDYLFGAVFAFAGLNFLLFSPVTFQVYWVAVDVALLFAFGGFLSSRSNMIRRVFSTARHRKEAVRTGAAAMFYEAGIANTDAEMGVLIYLSLLERRLEIIADRGVLKGVPALDWNQILFELHQTGKEPDPENLLKGLKRLGTLLAQHLPATGENPNELPDMPRFELI